MTQIFDTLFYPYQAPTFSSFSISAVASTVEVGYTVPTVKNFVWDTTNDGNINDSSISIRDVTGSSWVVQNETNSGAYTGIGAAITKTTISTYTWQVQGVNSKSQTFTRDYTVSWKFYGYYGESTNSTLTEADAKALRVSNLVSGIAGTYTFNTGGYKYWVFPEDYTASTFTDTATNLQVPILTLSTLSITNSFGVTKNYNMYRTLNIIGSGITIRVT